jgi:hypothetical protein
MALFSTESLARKGRPLPGPAKGYASGVFNLSQARPKLATKQAGAIFGSHDFIV